MSQISHEPEKKEGGEIERERERELRRRSEGSEGMRQVPLILNACKRSSDSHPPLRFTQTLFFSQPAAFTWTHLVITQVPLWLWKAEYEWRMISYGGVFLRESRSQPDHRIPGDESDPLSLPELFKTKHRQ